MDYQMVKRKRVVYIRKRSRKQVQKEIKELWEQGVLVREGTNRNGKQICKGVFDDRNIKK